MSIAATLVMVSDRELVTRPGLWEQHGRRVHNALLDWCLLHGLNAEEMPAENRIVRDVERCRIEYDEVVRDDDGKRLRADDGGFVIRRVHAQGETPPMPFPELLLALLPDRLEGTA